MDDDEDVLELGSRREPRPFLTRVVLILAAVGVVAGYFVVRGNNAHDKPSAASRSDSSLSTFVIARPPIVPPTTAASIPQWPKVDGACGSTAFLPIVSARPLRQHTGVHVVVGDRLNTVDVDDGRVTRRADLPDGVYATGVATTGDGTYASLVRCQPDTVITSTIVRLDGRRGLVPVATGSYQQLLSGGDHPWGLVYHDDGSTTLDPLDGGRALTVPVQFVPEAAYRNLIVGSAVVLSHSSSIGPQEVQLLDPATGKVVRSLGVASSMAVSRDVVLWTDDRCPHGQCALRAYDLAAGRTLSTSATVPRDAALWSAVLSPDLRSLAYVRQRSAPSRYGLGHPGTSNEVATVELASGRTSTVPGVELWSKSSPGLDYSADSRWLVMSFDAGTRVRLLLWHSGLTHPLEPSVQVTGQVAFAPLVVVAAD